MLVLDRLKLELSNQPYFSDEEYTQFLEENYLNGSDEYIKADMQKNLLLTVIDILEAVSNDINTMTTISTEFSNIGEAYHFIEMRIDAVREKLLAIPDPQDDYSVFSLMFTHRDTTQRRMPRKIVGREDIDRMIAEEINNVNKG